MAVTGRANSAHPVQPVGNTMADQTAAITAMITYALANRDKDGWARVYLPNQVIPIGSAIDLSGSVVNKLEIIGGPNTELRPLTDFDSHLMIGPTSYPGTNRSYYTGFSTYDLVMGGGVNYGLSTVHMVKAAVGTAPVVGSYYAIWDNYRVNLNGSTPDEYSHHYLAKVTNVVATSPTEWDVTFDLPLPRDFKTVGIVPQASNVTAAVSTNLKVRNVKFNGAPFHGQRIMTWGADDNAHAIDGGTFTLTYKGQTTSALAWNASAATIQAALEALSTIGVGNVSVTGSLQTLGSNDGPNIVMQGALAGVEDADITIASSVTSTTQTSLAGYFWIMRKTQIGLRFGMADTVVIDGIKCRNYQSDGIRFQYCRNIDAGNVNLTASVKIGGGLGRGITCFGCTYGLIHDVVGQTHRHTVQRTGGCAKVHAGRITTTDSGDACIDLHGMDEAYCDTFDFSVSKVQLGNGSYTSGCQNCNIYASNPKIRNAAGQLLLIGDVRNASVKDTDGSVLQFVSGYAVSDERTKNATIENCTFTTSTGQAVRVSNVGSSWYGLGNLTFKNVRGVTTDAAAGQWALALESIDGTCTITMTDCFWKAANSNQQAMAVSTITTGSMTINATQTLFNPTNGVNAGTAVRFSDTSSNSHVQVNLYSCTRANCSAMFSTVGAANAAAETNTYVLNNSVA